MVNKIPSGTTTLPTAFKKIFFIKKPWLLVKVFETYEFDKPAFQKYWTNRTGKYWVFYVGENKQTAQKMAVYRC